MTPAIRVWLVMVHDSWSTVSMNHWWDQCPLCHLQFALRGSLVLNRQVVCDWCGLINRQWSVFSPELDICSLAVCPTRCRREPETGKVGAKRWKTSFRFRDIEGENFSIYEAFRFPPSNAIRGNCFLVSFRSIKCSSFSTIEVGA